MKNTLLLKWLSCFLFIFAGISQGAGNQPSKVNKTPAETYTSQSVFNDHLGISGLDNPRQLSISKDGKQVFVVSGDDNALSIFTRQKGGSLQFKQVFKNSDNPALKLEGASDVISFNNAEFIVTSSFYDGAVSLFKKTKAGPYEFVHTLSDNLTPDRVFKDPAPIGKLDTLQLLGAWDLFKLDQQRFAVASYQSNAISFFQIKDGQLSPDENVNNVVNGHRFSRPLAIQSLGRAPVFDTLLVLGHEKAELTVLNRASNKNYSVAQVFNLNKHGCVGPQAVSQVNATNRLYVACTGSNNIIVLSDLGNQIGKKRLELLQTLKAPSLKGISSLAFTLDGKTGYGAAESGRGIVVLNTDYRGNLEIKKTILHADLFAVSSLTLSDINTLFVTAAKQDAVFVLDVSTLN
ncbi:hypothetical protein [Pseudoalteromonas citrea]|nr:hypothetical protein [Pseudoalteromonas citrea]